MKKTTNLRLEERLWVRLRERAFASGESMNSCIVKAISSWLGSASPASPPRPTFDRPAFERFIAERPALKNLSVVSDAEDREVLDEDPDNVVHHDVRPGGGGGRKNEGEALPRVLPRRGK